MIKKEFFELMAPRREDNDKYIVFVKGDMFLLLSKSMDIVYGPETDEATYQFDTKATAWLAAAYYYTLWDKVYPYIGELVEALEITPLKVNNEHDWKCTSAGLYDNTYECQKCGMTYLESIDSPDAKLPICGES